MKASFGELRSALQNPASTVLFERCLELIHDAGDDQLDEVQRTWVPYLKAHIQDWADEDRTLSGSLAVTFLSLFPEYASLIRGLNLDGLELTSRQISRLLQNQDMQTLTSLTLSNNRLGPIASKGLAEATHLTGLRHLDMSENPLGSKGVAEFMGALSLTQLQTLNLNTTNLGPSGARKITRTPLPSLKVLHMSDNKLSDSGLIGCVNAPFITHLETLSIAANRLSSTGFADFIERASLAALRSLSVRGNYELGEVHSLRALAQATHLVNLESLHLGQCRISDESAAHLQHADHLKHLTKLNLSHNIITSHTLSTLAQASYMQALTRLNLSHNVQLHQLRPLDKAHHLIHLTHLDLSACNLTRQTVRTLTSPHFANLERLLLQHNNFDGEALTTLANSTHLTRLTHLDMAHNPVDDDGIQTLARATHFTQLERLNFTGSRITDRGALALIDADFFTGLAMLSLRQTNLSERVRTMCRDAGRAHNVFVMV